MNFQRVMNFIDTLQALIGITVGFAVVVLIISIALGVV